MNSTPSKEKFFSNKKFYQHVLKANTASVKKSGELIKLFGGQIEQFLDHEVSYVLTDIPRSEWPPQGRDRMLQNAIKWGVKLMSLNDLLAWCSQYVSSQSSSDEDDEGTNVKVLQKPFIKFEDMYERYAPSVREFSQWPELNLHGNLPVGKSIFNINNSNLSTPNQSANITPQVVQVAHAGPRGVRRRNVFCEICNQKVNERTEDHITTDQHKLNTESLDWSQVQTVIDSLPSLSTLNMRRLTNLTPPNGVEHHEFLCLHKVESVSQLFFNSQSTQCSPIVDRKLVKT